MSKKDSFILEVTKALDNGTLKLSEDATLYFEALKGGDGNGGKVFTENGAIVLQVMKDNKDKFNNFFKAKDLAEVAGLSSRTVSGAMRKLVTDGYVEKMGENPVVYSLTEKGIDVNISND